MTESRLIVVYHYTDREGYNAIRAGGSDWKFSASQPPGDHPFGAYFTTLPPDTVDLARRLGIPKRKLEYFFQMHLADETLRRLPGGRGTFILYSPTDVVVPQSQHIAHGEHTS
jgi:hypothetical protein